MGKTKCALIFSEAVLKDKRVYLDNAATTRISEEVLNAMIPYMTNIYGNPSSPHSFGTESVAAVIGARESVASILGCTDGEIIFTSGGTESDNLAVCGAFGANRHKGKRVIVGASEHAAVLSACKTIEADGAEVVYLNPEADGTVSPETLERALTDDTVLVSIMTVNNEVGSISQIEKLAAVAHARGAIFHTDAVQAVGAVELNVEKTGVDLLSASAHKFYGPKGVGFLYVRKGTRVSPIIVGGHQERGLRGGTTPTFLIVGLAKAFERATRDLAENSEKIRGLRDEFVSRILGIDGTTLNGARLGELHAAPSIANISFDGIRADALVMKLDLDGVAVAAGAACSSGSAEVSHAIKAMVGEERAKGAVRFSFGKYNTQSDVDYAVSAVKSAVEELRSAQAFLTLKSKAKRV